MDVANINCVSAFATKDGSEIRELLAHRNSCIRHQSLAEARLPVNGATTPHYHPRTEEIYYIVEGHGSMQVGIRDSPGRPGGRDCDSAWCPASDSQHRLGYSEIPLLLRPCVRG
jgi:uncharacterized cupin superfamily protein